LQLFVQFLNFGHFSVETLHKIGFCYHLVFVQAGYDELTTSMSERLTSLKQRINQYQQDNPNVDVTRLVAALSALDQSRHDLAEWYVAVCAVCTVMLLN